MLLIQLILIIGLCVGGGLLLVATPVNARHLAVRRLLLLAFIVFGATAIVIPGLTTSVARRLGVGRGSDLLLYLLFVAFLAFVATTGRRYRDAERQITVLTRRLAIDEAPSPTGWSGAGGQAGPERTGQPMAGLLDPPEEGSGHHQRER